MITALLLAALCSSLCHDERANHPEPIGHSVHSRIQTLPSRALCSHGINPCCFCHSLSDWCQHCGLACPDRGYDPSSECWPHAFCIEHGSAKHCCLGPHENVADAPPSDLTKASTHDTVFARFTKGRGIRVHPHTPLAKHGIDQSTLRKCLPWPHLVALIGEVDPATRPGLWDNNTKKERN